MIIVMDTNVLVASLLKPHSKSASILRMVLDGILTIAYDLRIIEEYYDVLIRPKFSFNKNQVEAILDEIKFDGISVNPKPLPKSLPDPDDEPFFELAIASGADALITGNIRHFPINTSQGIKILSPADFLKLWRSR